MNTPVCQHLRTKKMFIPALADDAFVEKQDESASPCHYWCNRTMTEVGVDDQAVHPQGCNPQRSCFEE